MTPAGQLANYVDQPSVRPRTTPGMNVAWTQPYARSLAAFSKTLFRSADWQKFNRPLTPKDPIKGLEDHYIVENRGATIAFLKEHRLLSILLQAVEALNAHFGEAAIKTIRLDRDDEGIETLACLVMVSGNLEDAEHALQCFDESWWTMRCGDTAGRLIFDFELA